MSMSSLPMFKLCISSVVVIFCLLHSQMPCFGIFFFYFHQNVQTFATSCSNLVSSVYFKLLILVQQFSLLLPLSISRFYMIYSAFRLNKQQGKMQPCLTPGPTGHHSVSPHSVPTVASWPQPRMTKG